jgi:hypothetical protein
LLVEAAQFRAGDDHQVYEWPAPMRSHEALAGPARPRPELLLRLTC